MTLLIETARGAAVRRIPNASPLRLAKSQGHAAEEATHDAAPAWGLPDFVYSSVLSQVGSGTRELGDATIMVGDLGAVIQVKNRTSVGQDEERERRWVVKNVAKGLRQGSGTCDSSDSRRKR